MNLNDPVTKNHNYDNERIDKPFIPFFYQSMALCDINLAINMNKEFVTLNLENSVCRLYIENGLIILHRKKN